MSARCFQVHPSDNVATLLDDAVGGPVALIGPGGGISQLVAREAIARGHKIALADLAVGAPVIKYGARIGHATHSIDRGEWVHLKNLASDLDVRSGTLDLQSGAPTDTSSAYV